MNDYLRIPHELYPFKLRASAEAGDLPSEIWVKSGRYESVDEIAATLDRFPVIAIVGSRAPSKDARDYVGKLVRQLVQAGAVVASGGAIGIDGEAHERTLDANGETWCVNPAGHESLFPSENRKLFDRIEESGILLSPFDPTAVAQLHQFYSRNRWLVALADAVVIVEARLRSGTVNAARWARVLGKRLFVVPGAPWSAQFAGSLVEIERGAPVLTSIGLLFKELGFGPSVSGSNQPNNPLLPGFARSLSNEENALFSIISDTPSHRDQLCALSDLPIHVVSTALLTLALENVVVEGPAGFFRRV